MIIKSLLIAAAIIVAPVSANAYEAFDTENDIHGRSTFELVTALHEHGIDAERVEEWGQAIRVDAIDEAGRNYMVMVDQDTLRPMGENAVEVSAQPQVSGFEWPAVVNETPQSLASENDSDDSAAYFKG